MSAPRLPVALAHEARADLHSIALYGLLSWSDEEVERYHARIADALDSLARFPQLGRREDDLPGEVRSIGVGQHRVLYRVDADAIRVLRLLHERMEATIQIDD